MWSIFAYFLLHVFLFGNNFECIVLLLFVKQRLTLINFLYLIFVLNNNFNKHIP